MNFSASAQGKRVPRPVEIFHLFVIPSTALRSHVYCSAGLWYKCIPVSLSELDQFGRYYPTKSISGKIDSGCIRSEQMLCCSKCSFILYATSVLLSKSPISRLALWLNSPVRAIICNILKKQQKKNRLILWNVCYLTRGCVLPLLKGFFRQPTDQPVYAMLYAIFQLSLRPTICICICIYR